MPSSLKNKQNHQDRIKRMKQRIERDKVYLDVKFPDEVTIIGNPELLDKPDDSIKDDEKIL